MKKFLVIVVILVAVTGLVACENLVSVETTAEVTSIEVFADPEVILAEKVESLKAVVAAYAWPEYHSDCLDQTVAYNAAYADAATEFVSNHGKQGNDCGVFVLIAMRNSGWDESYPDERTDGQYKYLSDPKNGWTDVTNSIKSNDDALPGDVIITRGKGHVLLFVGEIDGFQSVMVSASYGKRAPMADRSNDIMDYVIAEQGRDHREYAVFRKTP